MFWKLSGICGICPEAVMWWGQSTFCHNWGLLFRMAQERQTRLSMTEGWQKLCWPCCLGLEMLFWRPRRNWRRRSGQWRMARGQFTFLLKSWHWKPRQLVLNLHLHPLLFFLQFRLKVASMLSWIKVCVGQGRWLKVRQVTTGSWKFNSELQKLTGMADSYDSWLNNSIFHKWHSATSRINAPILHICRAVCHELHRRGVPQLMSLGVGPTAALEAVGGTPSRWLRARQKMKYTAKDRTKSSSHWTILNLNILEKMMWKGMICGHGLECSYCRELGYRKVRWNCRIFACRASLRMCVWIPVHQEEFTTPAEEKQINSLYTVACWRITGSFCNSQRAWACPELSAYSKHQFQMFWR